MSGGILVMVVCALQEKMANQFHLSFSDFHKYWNVVFDGSATDSPSSTRL
jgi:hypothetical protein